MNGTTFHYDEISDTLLISFVPGHPATGIELNENLLLRLDKQQQRAISLSIFNYSILAQEPDAGPRSLPLNGLAALNSQTRALVLKLLQTAPLSDLLTVSTYTPSLTATVPIATLHNLRPLAVA